MMVPFVVHKLMMNLFFLKVHKNMYRTYIQIGPSSMLG